MRIPDRAVHSSATLTCKALKLILLDTSTSGFAAVPWSRCEMPTGAGDCALLSKMELQMKSSAHMPDQHGRSAGPRRVQNGAPALKMITRRIHRLGLPFAMAYDQLTVSEKP